MQLSHAIPGQNDKDINQIYSYRNSHWYVFKKIAVRIGFIS